MLKLKVRLKKDTKAWERMKKRLLTRTPKAVDVGWFSEARYDNGLPVAWIAMLNEYGYMTSGKYKGYHPPRPFFRAFLKQYVNSTVLVGRNIVPLVNQVALGKITWAEMHRRLGKQMVEWVKQQILNTNSPPNSPLTISLKGFNDPLINTGRMYDTVRFRIKRGKQK